jgi:hypothetical protein
MPATAHVSHISSKAATRLERYQTLGSDIRAAVEPERLWHVALTQPAGSFRPSRT